MKTIELYERLEAERRKGNLEALKEAEISNNLYWGYFRAKENGNELIDLYEYILEDQIPALVKQARELGIEEFTISSGFSGLQDTLAIFEEQGVTISGLTKVKTGLTGFGTDEPKLKNAIIMKIS